MPRLYGTGPALVVLAQLVMNGVSIFWAFVAFGKIIAMNKQFTLFMENKAEAFLIIPLDDFGFEL